MSAAAAVAVQWDYLPAHVVPQLELVDGCWVWTGYLNHDGYGRTPYQGRLWMLHRLTYELLHGPVPVGLELDHLCTNRACANPAHLEAVTHEENVRRAWARKTHCRNGHPYTPETRVSDYAGGFRCLICRRRANRDALRRRRTRLRAEAALAPPSLAPSRVGVTPVVGTGRPSP